MFFGRWLLGRATRPLTHWTLSSCNNSNNSITIRHVDHHSTLYSKKISGAPQWVENFLLKARPTKKGRGRIEPVQCKQRSRQTRCRYSGCGQPSQKLGGSWSPQSSDGRERSCEVRNVNRKTLDRKFLHTAPPAASPAPPPPPPPPFPAPLVPPVPAPANREA